MLTHIVKQTHTSSIYWHGNLLSYSTPLSLLVFYTPHERSAKPQLENAVFAQSYRFWEFAILFYSKLLVASFGSPCKIDGGMLFTPSLQHLQRL